MLAVALLTTYTLAAEDIPTSFTTFNNYHNTIQHIQSRHDTISKAVPVQFSSHHQPASYHHNPQSKPQYSGYADSSEGLSAHASIHSAPSIRFTTSPISTQGKQQYGAPEASHSVQYSAPVSSHGVKYAAPAHFGQYSAPASHGLQYSGPASHGIQYSASASHGIQYSAAPSHGLQYSAPASSHYAAPAASHDAQYSSGGHGGHYSRHDEENVSSRY